MISWLRRHRQKLQEVGTGIAIYESFVFFYDFVFYPFSIAYWGLVKGGAIAVFFSLVLNIIIFAAYEYMAIDWLGAHALRELADKENKSSTERLITWLHKEKTSLWEKILSPVVFIGLTLPIDPVIVAIHHRKQHFKGITAHDWMLLVGATAAANAWWLVKVDVVLELALYTWRHLLEPLFG